MCGVLFNLHPSLSFCYVLFSALLLILLLLSSSSRFASSVSLTHRCRLFVISFGSVLPAALCVRRSNIVAFSHGVLGIPWHREHFVFPSKMALCVGCPYMATGNATEWSSCGVSSRGMFLNLVKCQLELSGVAFSGVCYGKQGCTKRFVALEVWFHSTLAPALQRARVTPNASERMFFRCEEAFTRMRLVTGQRTRQKSTKPTNGQIFTMHDRYIENFSIPFI